jgi:hypothetical protein
MLTQRESKKNCGVTIRGDVNIFEGVAHLVEVDYPPTGGIMAMAGVDRGYTFWFGVANMTDNGRLMQAVNAGQIQFDMVFEDNRGGLVLVTRASTEAGPNGVPHCVMYFQGMFSLAPAPPELQQEEPTS